MGSTQEVTHRTTRPAPPRQMTGGMRINIVPREGGNRFKGSFFATGVNSSFQGNNYTARAEGSAA